MKYGCLKIIILIVIISFPQKSFSAEEYAIDRDEETARSRPHTIMSACEISESEEATLHCTASVADYLGKHLSNYEADENLFKWKALSDAWPAGSNISKIIINSESSFFWWSYWLIVKVEHESTGAFSVGRGGFDFKVPLRRKRS